MKKFKKIKERKKRVKYKRKWTWYCGSRKQKAEKLVNFVGVCWWLCLWDGGNMDWGSEGVG